MASPMPCVGGRTTQRACVVDDGGVFVSCTLRLEGGPSVHWFLGGDGRCRDCRCFAFCERRGIFKYEDFELLNHIARIGRYVVLRMGYTAAGFMFSGIQKPSDSKSRTGFVDMFPSWAKGDLSNDPIE